MPNHVTTILKIEDAGGVDLADIRRAFINEKGHVDLNAVIPMPECLRDFEPSASVISRSNAALGLIPDPKTLGGGDDLSALTKRLEFSNTLRDISTPARATDIPHIVRAIQNYHECGFCYWFDWSTAHWGTKWNCYHQPDGGHAADATEFRFDTAWSHPRRMIETISEKLPTVTFHVRYADEDLGSNCGEYRVLAGTAFDIDIASRWDERSTAEKRRWTEKAFRVLYGDDEPREAHGYDANWDYDEAVYDAHYAKQKAEA